jgi:non-ribosomal peptide synthetase component F
MSASLLAAERSELTVEQRQRRAARPQSRLDQAKSRLAAMERRRERWGDACYSSVEDVERQRALVARLEAGVEPDPTPHEQAQATLRPMQTDASSIVWLKTPQAIPGLRKVKLCGWDPSMCARPGWLPDDAVAA